MNFQRKFSTCVVALVFLSACNSARNSAVIPSNATTSSISSSSVQSDDGTVSTQSTSTAALTAGFHEFQADCTITEHLSDDPIVFPGEAGVSHNHAFFGSIGVNANTTLASIEATKNTSCTNTNDHSAYWMPTLYQDGKIVDPDSTIVYYKSGIRDYTQVVPFPVGIRMVVGNPHATLASQFGATPFPNGYYSCVSGSTSVDFPASCPIKGNKLIVRLYAPSCWDGVNLDSPTHNTHIVYPVNGVCPADHKVAVPELQFKIPYTIAPYQAGHMNLAFSSGGAYTFHYDFFEDWDKATMATFVSHCINGGRQCDAFGYDQHKP